MEVDANVAIAFLVGAGNTGCRPNEPSDPCAGLVCPRFSLPPVDGKTHSLVDHAGVQSWSPGSA